MVTTKCPKCGTSIQVLTTKELEHPSCPHCHQVLELSKKGKRVRTIITGVFIFVVSLLVVFLNYVYNVNLLIMIAMALVLGLIGPMISDWIALKAGWLYYQAKAKDDKTKKKTK
ncbi:MAG: hypothetical protein LBR25_06510 [Erysipelotrichaceae bacterium]|jgi:uncharacterized paraquat-inducible protein A|nr:hypothetical protein [Erysipelotrichaceae bacterium]